MQSDDPAHPMNKAAPNSYLQESDTFTLSKELYQQNGFHVKSYISKMGFCYFVFVAKTTKPFKAFTYISLNGCRRRTGYVSKENKKTSIPLNTVFLK